MATAAKVVLVGAGEWGARHLEALRRLGLLGAVVENSQERRRLLQGASPDLKFCASLEELVPEDGRAAVLAAPAALHFELGLKLLERGLHLLCEKPLALNAAQARKLQALAREKGLVLAVGHLLEHHPARKAINAAIQGGRLGELLELRFVRCKFGRVRTEENVLQSFATHDISTALSLAGCRPARVWARGAAFVTPGIADSVVWGMEWSSGLLATGRASWLEPAKEQKAILVGRKAMLLWEDAQGAKALKLLPYGLGGQPGRPELKAAAGQDGETLDCSGAEALETELLSFLAAVNGGAALPNSGAQGVEVCTILDAMNESMAHGGGALVPDFEPGQKDYKVHPSAEVSPKAKIGRGSAIWHFCHIMGPSTIGENVVFGQNCHVAPGVIVGNGVRIQNNVSLYDGVVLEDEVFIGPSAVFTNVKHPRSHVSRKDEYAKTIVRKRASVGANSTIVCGHEIGAYAFVAAGATVASNVSPHALVGGCPARRIGWVCACGEVLPRAGGLACARCGRSYREEGARLTLVSGDPE